MDVLISVLNFLKSPKASAVVLVFCALVLFVPYDWLNISRPAFVDNYEAVVTTVLFVSMAVLFVEAILYLGHIARLPGIRRRRATRVQQIFLSLNLDELCVLYAMVESGTKVVKGEYSNHTMLSLRQKGALMMAGGSYNSLEYPHIIPDDLFEIVREGGFERFPLDFRNSTRFVDEVRERVDRATNWRRW